MLELIKSNINWIKDIMMLLFAGTATIITILTYRRARATILQPIRNEVIKKQSGLLSNLLQELRQTGNSFEESLDYVNIAQTNVLLTLRDYGFVFNKQKELIEKTNEELAGWMPCGENNIIKDIEIIGAFISDKELPTLDLGKERYENAKKGIIKIEKIYLTKKHSLFLNKLHDFSSNPFMPNSIQKTLDGLFIQVRNNLIVSLKDAIEDFMKEFCKHYFEEKNIPKFNPIGVYNGFNHSRIHHQKMLNDLRREIRNYLLIDEPW